jgi:hypothetical protein
MTNVLLVAVAHELSGSGQQQPTSRLVGECCFSKMQETVLPLITDGTALIVESSNDGLLTARNGQRYSEILEDIHPYFEELVYFRPTIISRDYFLEKYDTEKALDRINDDMMELGKFLLRHVQMARPTAPPRCFEEMFRLIKEDEFEFHITKPTNYHLKDLARKVASLQERRDNRFMKLIEESKDKYEQIIFVAGLYHCVKINREKGWPMINTIDEGAGNILQMSWDSWLYFAKHIYLIQKS